MTSAAAGREAEDAGGACPLCGVNFSHLANLLSHAGSCQGSTTMPGMKRKLSINSAGGQEKDCKISQPIASIFQPKKQKSCEETKMHVYSAGKEVGQPAAEVAMFQPEKLARPGSAVPLAERMRPSHLSGLCGQARVTARLERLLADLPSLPSLVLWGPPGCGKTSLANVIATRAKGSMKFVKMSAVTCGVAEVKDVIKTAKTELTMFKRRTILFLDEVHRFNKSQQDSFLPHIESGTIIFIGATTENPSFSLNAAMLSRCQVVALGKLSQTAVMDILERALQVEGVTVVEAEAEPELEATIVERAALLLLADTADGDARAALNSLELAVGGAARVGGYRVGVAEARAAVGQAGPSLDKEQHYQLASALQKSIRGGADSAALYWLARALRAGEDPVFLARRMVRCASEDVGLGDSAALPLAVATMQGTQLLGRPECNVLLAHCATYLARARKSHAVHGALGRAYAAVDNPGLGGLPGVPLHLRPSTSSAGRELGWGSGYSANLSTVGGLQYLPDSLQDTDFFHD